jgi:uncharacterized protein (PEP-CTERM system associated)
MPADRRRWPFGLAGALLAGVSLAAWAGGAAAQSAPGATGAGATGAGATGAGAGATGAPGAGARGPGGAAEAVGAAETGIYAPTAPDMRIGGFFGLPFGSERMLPDGGTGQAYSLVPSLTLRATATDNVNLSATNPQHNIFFDVVPAIIATADTDRLQGRFGYTPLLRYYTRDTNSNQWNNIFFGAGTATLLPDRVFLDLRASGTVQAISGGFAPGSTPATAQNNLAQTYSFQATPYVVHRFGGAATAVAGYSLQYSQQQGNAQSLTPGGTPFFVPLEFTSNTGFAAVRTGEDFGRLAMEARGTATAYTGTGMFDGAHRGIALLEARYAITPNIAVLAQGGYESQYYATTPDYEVNEPVWAVGVLLRPGPDSMLALRYGHRDGFDSFSLEGSLALGGRTRLVGSYSDQLSVALRNPADLLSTTTVDRYGNPVDSVTGAPALPLSSGNFTTLQSGLFRAKRANAFVVQSFDRDTISLGLTYVDQVPIAASPGTVQTNQTSLYGTATWSHALTPRATLIGTLQYGVSESGNTNARSTLFLASAMVTYQFTERLYGTLQYMVTNRDTDAQAVTGTNFGGSAGNALQNQVIAMLRQTF